MLNSQVDTLLKVTVANHLVDNNTDGRLGNVVDDTGLTVVVLVWHTLLDGTVGLDVNNVTNLVDLQVGRERNSTSLLEVSLESVSSTGSVTTTVSTVSIPILVSWKGCFGDVEMKSEMLGSFVEVDLYVTLCKGDQHNSMSGSKLASECMGL